MEGLHGDTGERDDPSDQRSGDGDPGVAAWSLFLRAHVAVVRRLERELAEERGLPLTWYDVLLELAAAPERRLRMQQLGDRVVLSRSRVSRVVDELVRKGLVRRDPDPADRRGAYAVLTEAGLRALREAAPVYLRGIAEHFSSQLTPAEIDAFRTGLQKVLAAQDALTARETGRPAPLPVIPR
jgi:DNA-binding MarR family transcriptional regulator